MASIILTYILKAEKGATAIEYALIAGGIAVAISVAVFSFGADITALFEDVGALFSERPE